VVIAKGFPKSVGRVESLASANYRRFGYGHADPLFYRFSTLSRICLNRATPQPIKIFSTVYPGIGLTMDP
jgi:hypothetical protein